MKDEFKTYLKSIGITDVLIDRVSEIHDYYANTLEMLDDEIQDIFVSEYRTNEDLSVYENLWFFSKNYFMEAKLFISQDDFDIYHVNKPLDWIDVTKKDYNFVKATDQSRLNIRWESDRRAYFGVYKASRGNCDSLKNIYIKHFLSKLKV